MYRGLEKQLIATTLSVQGLSLPPLCEDMVQLAGGEILCSEYALPGTEDLAVNVVMLSNHGAVCAGKNAGEALTVCEVLEKSAEIYLLVSGKGKLELISRQDIEIMREFIRMRYGQRQTGTDINGESVASVLFYIKGSA